MPKRVIEKEPVNPVRSRLAGLAAAPVELPKVTQEPTPRSHDEAPPPTPLAPEPSPPEQPPVEARPVKARPQRSRQAPRRAKAVAHPDGPMRNRKFMVTDQEAERMDETLKALSSAFGGKIHQSQVSRAMWSILGDLEERIARRGKGAPRALPSTGDAEGQAEYEAAVHEFLAEFLGRG